MNFKTIYTPPHLVNEHFDDRYFDVFNAVNEAHHIYFTGCDIVERVAQKRPFVIGETGFGAGRVLVALLDLLDNTDLKDREIIYQSVELYPITAERMVTILDGFRDQVGGRIDDLAQAYGTLDMTQSGWQTVSLNGHWGQLHLNLFVGEAMEMLENLKHPCDAWFLEGHGPKKNPSIWRDELLKTIGHNTVLGGTCATYTVAVAVRKALISGGFEIELPPGFGGKKNVLKGIKSS